MNIGEKIQLLKKEFDVVGCTHCSHAMVNIDADEIGLGDLVKIKFSSLRISNPDTKEDVCIDCDIIKRPSKRVALSNYMKSDSNDDSSWHRSSSSSSDSGSSFGGGFGGFGGGSFGGGGASGGF